MRLKAEAIFEFGTDGDQRPNKIVRQYRNQYKAFSEILDKHPQILEMAHRDLAKLSQATSGRGCKAGFTSENLFRPVLVMQRKGLEYREASVRIAERGQVKAFKSSGKTDLARFGCFCSIDGHLVLSACVGWVRWGVSRRCSHVDWEFVAVSQSDFQVGAVLPS